MVIIQRVAKSVKPVRFTGLIHVFILLLILSLISLAVTADENISNISNVSFSTPLPVEQTMTNDTHDYVLEKIILPSESAYIRPGRSINPKIMVKNQGGDDMKPDLVPVEAWLGDSQLIPVIAVFPPMKGKTSALFSLRFMIPSDINPEGNHLVIKIDPWNTRDEKGTGINENTTRALVNIEDKNEEKPIRSSSMLSL
jgi:hypothetical protein